MHIYIYFPRYPFKWLVKILRLVVKKIHFTRFTSGLSPGPRQHFLLDGDVGPWRLEIPELYPLVMTNIAVQNGPFIDDLPIKDGDVP